MVYGELIVYFPDGSVQNYDIDKPTTAIGRSPGNDVVLPTSSASRYHAHISVSEGRVTFVDLGTVNGTFVNDELLQPNSSFELSGDDEIRIGDARLFFRPAAGGTAGQSPKPQSSVQDTQAMPVTTSGLIVVLEEPHQTVAPGSRMQLKMTIENPGEDVRLCDVALGGMDGKWAKTNRREVRLEGREKTEVLISVSPPRSFKTKPGRYELTVSVIPQDDPGQPVENARFIEVVEYHGMGMVVRSSTSQPDTYKVYVQNQGNVTAEVQLGGWHAGQALKYKFAESRLRLDPGETQQVAVRIQPRQAGRSPGATTFAVVARSLSASGFQAAVPVSYAGGGEAGRSALLGALVPIVLAVVLGVVVIGVAAFFLLNRGDGRKATEEGPLPEGAGAEAASPDVAPTVPPVVTAATEEVASAPEATSAPSITGTVDVRFDPVTVIRYQDAPQSLLLVSVQPPLDQGEEIGWQIYNASGEMIGDGTLVVGSATNLALDEDTWREWLRSIYAGEELDSLAVLITVRDSVLQGQTAPLQIQDLACGVSSSVQAWQGPATVFGPANPALVEPGQTVYPVGQQSPAENEIWYKIMPAPRSERWVPADQLECKLNDVVKDLSEITFLTAEIPDQNEQPPPTPSS
jgi:pSer/pThr/pTyr-binding forkhead associated (FHA) protein